MEEHYTVCQHSTPFILNGPKQFLIITQYSCDIVTPCCMNSTISTQFLSHKTVVISYQADNISLNSLACLVRGSAALTM
jgi:hypothetical protein